MAVNYLTDFTKVLNESLDTYDGISHAIGLDSPDEFRKQKAYKNEIVKFRKSIRTKPILTLTDIFDIIEDFVDEESLSLYSIEKAFTFIKEYEGSESVIKSIMNKFDKTLRQSINKDILDQYGIEAKVRRSSRFNFETLDSTRLVDKRKARDTSSRRYYANDESKSPTWEIQIKIPIKHIKVSNAEDESFKVDVPLPENTKVRLTVNYAFRPLTQFFINNITKLNDYKKDINLFIKDLMQHTDRQLSFSTNVWTSINIESHPYINGRHNSGNWCQGDWSFELNRAYKKMDITLLCTSVHEWMTTYCIGQTQPHNDISTMYKWLPKTASENSSVSNMPTTDSMLSSCWTEHQSTKICKERDCAFMHKCEYFLVNSDNESVSQLESRFVDDVNKHYASELYSIFNSDPETKARLQNAFLGLRSHIIEHVDGDKYEVWEDTVSKIISDNVTNQLLLSVHEAMIKRLSTSLGFSIDAICQIGYKSMDLFNAQVQLNNQESRNEEENL